MTEWMGAAKASWISRFFGAHNWYASTALQKDCVAEIASGCAIILQLLLPTGGRCPLMGMANNSDTMRVQNPQRPTTTGRLVSKLLYKCVGAVPLGPNLVSLVDRTWSPSLRRLA